MPPDRDTSAELRERVLAAIADETPLAIGGGGTKAFLGRLTQAEDLPITPHRGIVSYEPTELVLTARAGTRLDEIEAVLAEQGQMLAFEPPRFESASTLGGAVAAGLSGPRRPYVGAARDFVLGVKLLNGKGEILSFGGQVMKNVAGYDLSRLMTGAMGTLGVLLEISLKVLPIPAATTTLAFETDAAAALDHMNSWAGRPLPLSGAFHDGQILRVRLCGTRHGVDTAAHRLGGARDDHYTGWDALRDQRLDFFATEDPLWRLSVPSTTPPLGLPGDTLLDWGGAQRWLRSHAEPWAVRTAVERAGGHATLFRHGDRTGDVYHPLPPILRALHERLKRAFDPRSILNRGRMYESL